MGFMAGLLFLFLSANFYTEPGVSNLPFRKTWKRTVAGGPVSGWQKQHSAQESPFSGSGTKIFVSPGLKSDILRGNFPSQRTATSRIIAYLS